MDQAFHLPLGGSRWLLSVALSVLFSANGLLANDLERLQGVWVCETRPYLVEFHDQVAKFRGLNPFVQSPPRVSQYVEVALPFTIHTDGDARRLEFDPEAFSRAAPQLKLLPVQAVHFAKPPTGNYRLELSDAEPATDVLQLTLAPSKPAHLDKPVYSNADTLRRLTVAQEKAFAELVGVWQGEIRCGDAIVRSGAWAIIPGWIFEQTKIWEPPLPNVEKAHPEITTLKLQLDPRGSEFTLWEPVTVRGAGLFQSTVWQNDIREYRGSATVGEQGIQGKLYSPKLKELLASKDFESRLATAGLGFGNDLPGVEATKLAAERKRRFDLAKKLSAAKGEMTIHATRIEARSGEDALATWLRTIHPDRPMQEQLIGDWALKSKAAWKPGRDGDGFEGVAIAGPQTWTFSPGKLSIKAPGSEKSKSFSFSFFYEDNLGAILCPTPESVNQTIYCQCRLKENELTILFNRPSNWPDNLTPNTAGDPVRFSLERTGH